VDTITRLTYGQSASLCRCYGSIRRLEAHLTNDRYAMLVGQPPFQSTSQNEIYRRARSVEYEWPKLGKHPNDIPEEAKDLVCQLLKVEAEERPDPDQVIGHPFFAMHGGNAIPLVMEDYFRRETPKYLDVRHLPRGDVMLKGFERLSLRALARQCGVGHLTGDVLALPAVGEDIDISLYGQCQDEEDAGYAPVVPMPKDMVYTSKFTSGGVVSTYTHRNSGSSAVDSIMLDPALARPSSSRSSRSQAVESLPIASVQSHAASLRAAHVPSKSSKSHAAPEQAAASNGTIRSRDAAAASVRGRRGLLNELPVRPTLKGSDAGGIGAKTLARNPGATHVKKVHVLDEDLPPNVSKPITKDQHLDEARSDSDAKRRVLSTRTRVRIAANVQKELQENSSDTRKSSIEITEVRRVPKSASPTPIKTLIGPDEVPESLSNTKPDDVLRQLQALHKQLETSLKHVKKERDHLPSQDIALDKDHDIKHRPVVVKWVDYTNKFGIGYILQNGTVGCVFKGDETSYPTCVVVADVEPHLKKRKVSAYPYRHQMVPEKGAPVEFVENCDGDGLKRVFVPSAEFQVSVSATGVPDRLSPGVDVHEYEKRKKLSLWDKFGKYMTQTLGKSDEAELQESEEASVSESRHKNAAGPFVRFYQRLGNVGIWGFGDGSFQFNFPDHTKVVVSDGGAFLDFYHLPIRAAQAVKNGGSVDPIALVERAVLSYPTIVMLSGQYRGHNFNGLINANELFLKVAFIKDVLGLWVNEGGLGRMGRKKFVKWNGVEERGGKLVWVTVGVKGGDARYEMPVVKTEK